MLCIGCVFKVPVVYKSGLLVKRFLEMAPKGHHSGARALMVELAGPDFKSQPKYVFAHRGLKNALANAHAQAPLQGASLKDWLRKAKPYVQREIRKYGSKKKGGSLLDADAGAGEGDASEGDADAEAEAEDADAPADETEQDVAPETVDAEPLESEEAPPEADADASPDLDDTDEVSASFQPRLERIQALLKHRPATIQAPSTGGALSLPAYPRPQAALKLKPQRSWAKEMGHKMRGGAPLPMVLPQGSQQDLESLSRNLNSRPDGRPASGVILYNYGGSNSFGPPLSAAGGSMLGKRRQR